MKLVRVTIWILLVLLIWFSSGCINAKKASNYMRNNPDVAARLCADLFPVKTKTDTRAYDSSIAIIDSLIEVIANKEYISEEQRGTLIAEINRLQTARPDCDSVVAPVRELADRESQRAADLSRSNKQLQDAARNVKPIRDTIENTAKVTHLQNQLQNCADDKLRLTEKLSTTTEDRDDYKSSARKWKTMFWVLLVLVVIWFLRKQIFSLITKLPFMKSILIFLLASVLLFSCSPAPDNVVHGTDTVLDRFEPSNTIPGEVDRIYKTSYKIEPTWGQAGHYAFKTGYAKWFVVGLLLLGVAVWLLYTTSKDTAIVSKWDPRQRFRIVLLAVFLVGSALCIYPPLSNVKNNVKWVPKEQYDHYMQKDGNIRAVWDSIFQNNLLEGAAVK